MLTDTTRVRGVIAAIKSSAVINRSRGEIIFSFKPSRSSIGFHVAYCSGNSPFAVKLRRPASTLARTPLPPRPRSLRWSAQFLRIARQSVSRSTRGGGWALQKMSSPVSGAETYLLQARLALRESKLSASAIGSPNSSTWRLQFRTTLAASRFEEKLLWWTRVTPFRKLQELRLAQTSMGTTSNLGSPSG